MGVRPVFLAGLLAALCAFAFSPTLSNGFTNWDDNLYLTENPAVKSFSLPAFAKPERGLYKPLVFASFAAEYRLFGLNPFVYHSDNLILHICCCLLVFLAAQMLGAGAAAAFFGSAFFGLHPLRVESVAWVSERKDLLCGFFILASFVFYLGKKNAGNYPLSVLCFLISMLSKPAGLAFPFVLLVVDWFLRRPFSWADKLPYIAVACFFALADWRALKAAEVISNDAGFLARVSLSAHALLFYLAKTFAPFGLSAHYPFPAGWPSEIPAFWLLSIAATAALVWAAFRFLGRELLFGFLFFLTAILPLLGWIGAWPAAAMDHLTYIPSMGLGFGLALWLEKKTPFRGKIAALFAVCLLLSGLTFARCGVWKDSVSLWSGVLSKYPQASLALKFRAKAYESLGKKNEALADYSAAISAKPDFREIYIRRAYLLFSLGKTEAAFADMEKAVSLNPRSALANSELGNLSALAGRTDEALGLYNKALALDSGFASGYLNRGILYLRLGKKEKAREDFSAAIRLAKKKTPEPYFYRAQTEPPQEALEDYGFALSADGEYYNALVGRGKIYASLGNYGAAEKDFSLAASVSPDSADARAGLAAVYALKNDFRRAVAEGSAAIRLRPDAANYMNQAAFFLNLGLSKASRENYGKAVGLGAKPNPAFLSALRLAEKENGK